MATQVTGAAGTATSFSNKDTAVIASASQSMILGG